MIWTSGQLPVIGIDQVPDDFEDQCIAAFDNLAQSVREAGGDLSTIVKINVYLADIERLPQMNLVYRRYFPDEPFPARTTVEVSSFRGKTRIEADAIAYLVSSSTAEVSKDGAQ